MDINFDSVKTTLGSQNNWASVVYNGGGVIGSGLEPQELWAQIQENFVDPMLQELTYEDQLEFAPPPKD